MANIRLDGPAAAIMEALVRGQREEQDNAPRPLAEAVCDELKMIYARYLKPTFKAGDLVTPRKGYNLVDPGEPHIILEMRENPEAIFVPDDGSCRNGARFDMRVATLASGKQYAAFWCESWQYEEFKTE